MSRKIPTFKTPVVIQDDGTATILIKQGRTLRIVLRHRGLMDPTGYKARFGLTDKYGNPLLGSASTDDGSITFSPALDPDPPHDQIGTYITIVVSDEDMDLLDAKQGKFDAVLENPAGEEDTVIPGDWILWQKVSP